MDKLKAPQWVFWVVCTTTAALTIAAFAYANFPTRIEYNALHDTLDHRLDRLENKLDQLLER